MQGQEKLISASAGDFHSIVITDKSIYTFWDFYDDIEELITLFEDSYNDGDDEIENNNELEDNNELYEEYEYNEDGTTLFDETIKFIKLYEKMMEIFKSENCNLKDDKGNTMLVHMLSKYYCNGFEGSIIYKEKEYSIKELIKVLIKNDKFEHDSKNFYDIDILSMAKIIKKYQINYEEYDDILSYIEHNKDDIYEDCDELITEIENVVKNKFV